MILLTCFVSFPLSIKCDAGKAAGTVDVSICESCSVGRYRNADMVAATCGICPVGWSSDLESVKCRECEVGRYGNIDGNETRVCENCKKGTYRGRNDNLTECKNCSVGMTLGVTSGSKCTDCIPGRFSDQLGSNTTDCGKCPIGYSTEEGAGTDTSPTKDKCVACLLGTYADTEGLTKCSACAAGTYSDVHVTQSIEGKDFCKSCIVGQYRPSQIKVNNIMTKTELTKCK